MPEHPEHALSRPAYYNMGHILASCVPRLQFPYRILPGNPFLLLIRLLLEQFWVPLFKEHVTCNPVGVLLKCA